MATIAATEAASPARTLRSQPDPECLQQMKHQYPGQKGREMVWKRQERELLDGRTIESQQRASQMTRAAMTIERHAGAKKREDRRRPRAQDHDEQRQQKIEDHLVGNAPAARHDALNGLRVKPMGEHGRRQDIGPRDRQRNSARP